MINSYRDWFSDPESGIEYEKEYASSTYSAILWEIEKSLILRELEKLKSGKKNIDYLDFACGTGRIIGFVQPHVNTATGVDISKSMLEVARKKLRGAELICRDITVDATPPERQYDLITCFRFLRNSEERLRVAAFKALAARLRDRNSCLIINNHGNLFSYHFFRSSLEKVLKSVHHKQPLNYLSHATVCKMIEQAGLEVIAMYGYSYLSSKSLLFFSPDFVRRTESFLANIPLMQMLGGVQMYVARLR